MKGLNPIQEYIEQLGSGSSIPTFDQRLKDLVEAGKITRYEAEENRDRFNNIMHILHTGSLEDIERIFPLKAPLDKDSTI